MRLSGIPDGTLCLSLSSLISSLAFYKTLSAVIRYSLASSDSSSHIVLIPIISFFLLYLERQRIFSVTRTSIVPGASLALLGILLYWLVNRSSFSQAGNWQLSLETLCVVLVWMAGFLLCYGFAALRAAAFPLLFLLLMVPLPDVILDRDDLCSAVRLYRNFLSHFPIGRHSRLSPRIPAFRARRHH